MFLIKNHILKCENLELYANYLNGIKKYYRQFITSYRADSVNNLGKCLKKI